MKSGNPQDAVICRVCDWFSKGKGAFLNLAGYCFPDMENEVF
ncbi:hypothetical protein SAMN06265374_0281 [Roseibium denhamense]|uniref:Uncharacterized protein n=1 Tax=Roseibium denhamense TaxID=76305 RepID=A0ABY1N5R1_9HYPH|nr:hypothetical protein SAMN06265374_0281 [Roseibium denhamense]